MASYKKTDLAKEQPAWVCYDCGRKYGTIRGLSVSCWHRDTCGVCGLEKSVTEPRDFGYLLKGWVDGKQKPE
jgi:anaerobic ribonucleoside-triphosphate reductase